jgi:hypothetical protein
MDNEFSLALAAKAWLSPWIPVGISALAGAAPMGQFFSGLKPV